MSGMICPECERPLKFSGHPHRGQRIQCNNCKIKLTVTDVKPLELEAAIPANQATKPKKEAGMVETTCPQCDYMLKLSNRLRPGEKIVCSVCHTQLQVLNINPLELDVARLIKPQKNRW